MERRGRACCAGVGECWCAANPPRTAREGVTSSGWGVMQDLMGVSGLGFMGLGAWAGAAQERGVSGRAPRRGDKDGAENGAMGKWGPVGAAAHRCVGSAAVRSAVCKEAFEEESGLGLARLTRARTRRVSTPVGVQGKRLCDRLSHAGAPRGARR